MEPAGGVSEVGQLWQDIEDGLREQAARLSSENRELQERLMVSEATVHAQAEQLKDYRVLLSESRSDPSDLEVVDMNVFESLIRETTSTGYLDNYFIFAMALWY